MAYKGLPRAKVKRIKKIEKGVFFSPALGFTGEFWRAGDFCALMVANHALGRKYNFNGVYFLAFLHTAAELERKNGFFNLYILSDLLGLQPAYNRAREILLRGFFTRVPFPDNITHIARVRKVYKLSDKGREALRYFRAEYMKHQKLSKKARLAMLETLNTF